MREAEIRVFDKQIYPTHTDEANNLFHGNVALKNNNIYITYKDMNSSITTIIKATETGVLVKRIGALGGQLNFQKGKITSNIYNTPFGMLPIEIETKQCEVYLLEKGIKIYIEYIIMMDNEIVSNNTFMIITN